MRGRVFCRAAFEELQPFAKRCSEWMMGRQGRQDISQRCAASSIMLLISSRHGAGCSAASSCRALTAAVAGDYRGNDGRQHGQADHVNDIGSK